MMMPASEPLVAQKKTNNPEKAYESPSFESEMTMEV